MPTPSTQKVQMPEVAGGIGLGLLTLIGGLLLHGHYEPIKRVCDSGLGTLGQALSKSAQVHCGLDSFLAVVGTILIVIGAGILAVALLTVAALWYTARQEAGQPAASKSQPVTGDLTPPPTDSSTTASSGE
jgi:hypothetical protein